MICLGFHGCCRLSPIETLATSLDNVRLHVLKLQQSNPILVEGANRTVEPMLVLRRTNQGLCSQGQCIKALHTTRLEALFSRVFTCNETGTIPA